MMRKLREFVAIGDLHLTDSSGKGGLASYIENHDKHVVQLMDQPLSWAAKRGIKDVVLLGDICENPRMSYEAQLALLSVLRQDFVFHIIPGNHDMLAEDPEAGHSLQIVREFRLPNVNIYETPTVVDKVYFLPWPHSKFKKDLLNVAHIDVQGSVTDSGRENKSDKLNSSNADALIGHIHTSQQVRNSLYPGTLYQTNFGESADKFFAHCVYDDGWDKSLIKVKPKYVLHTVKVTSRKTLKSVPTGPHNLVKLIITDKAKITAADYQHLNVVKVMTANTAAEQALAEIADLNEGSDIEISTDEFFTAWLDQQNVSTEEREAATAARLRTLKGQAK